MQDIFELSAIEIKNSQIMNELHAGVVITGGGSLIRGTKDIAEQILGMEVNLGSPRGLSGGLIREIESPIYATGVGLVLHRYKELSGKIPLRKSKQGQTKKSQHTEADVSPKKIFTKIKSWFDEL